MNSDPDHVNAASAPEGGTAEETHLTVKRLSDEWIAEDNLGQTVASGSDRSVVIESAKAQASQTGATAIRILKEDGSLDGIERP